MQTRLRKLGCARFAFAVALLLALPLTSGGNGGAFAQRGGKLSAPEPWRRVPPKAGPERPLKLPEPREVSLKNGLRLVMVEDHRAPIVTVFAGVPFKLPRSSDIETLTKEVALAEATGELITEGAGSRTSEQLAREVETLGGRISSAATDDYAEVTVSVVSENIDRMMELFGDVLLRPAFPEDEVALHKRNRIQNLVVQRQDPAYLAGEQFDRAVFGPHPYAISSPTPASIEALDRDKIRRFYETNFSPEGSVIVMVGDFNSKRMEAKVREVLEGWKQSRIRGGAIESPRFPRPSERRVYLIDRPGSEQADFRIGGLGVTRSHPDFFALLVANALLGAGTNSRLFLNIRERKGFAYDVYSSIEPLRDAGTFYGGAETRPEVTAQAIKEMLREFDRLSNVRVAPRELLAAKRYLKGLFSISLATQGGITGRIAQLHLLDLGADYLQTYRARVDSVTQLRVQQVARKYIRTDRPVVVVVGDASKLRSQLESIGRVEVLNTEGEAAARTAH